MTNMRHFMNILESMYEPSFTSLTDGSIDSYISKQTRDMGFSKPAPEVIWDILLMVKSRRERGATDEEVMAAFTDMYPTRNGKWALKMLRRLDAVVQKIDDRWHWVADRTDEAVVYEGVICEDDDDEEELDIDPMTRQAISMQLNLTYQVLDMVKDLGTFTMAELVGQLHQMGLPEPMASEFAEHFTSQFPKTLKRTGDSFEYVEEDKPAPAMDTLRGLLGSDDPDMDALIDPDNQKQ